MAKVTGPMLSLSASGAIAQRLSFSNYNGIGYARINTNRVKRRNARTIYQLAWRDYFHTVYFIWKNLSPDVLELLAERQKKLNMTGWNLYAKLYMLRKPTDAGAMRAGMCACGGLTL